jgi:hypothetical protein
LPLFGQIGLKAAVSHLSGFEVFKTFLIIVISKNQVGFAGLGFKNLLGLAWLFSF